MPNQFDINKTFISIYDQFLAAFDRKHAPSVSQQKERSKHDRIATLRDTVQPNASAPLDELKEL